MRERAGGNQAADGGFTDVEDIEGGALDTDRFTETLGRLAHRAPFLVCWGARKTSLVCRHTHTRYPCNGVLRVSIALQSAAEFRAGTLDDAAFPAAGMFRDVERITAGEAAPLALALRPVAAIRRVFDHLVTVRTGHAVTSSLFTFAAPTIEAWSFGNHAPAMMTRFSTTSAL